MMHNMPFQEFKDLADPLPGDALTVPPRLIIANCSEVSVVASLTTKDPLPVPDSTFIPHDYRPASAACYFDLSLAGIYTVLSEDLMDCLPGDSILLSNGCHGDQLNTVIIDDTANLLPSYYFHSSYPPSLVGLIDD